MFQLLSGLSFVSVWQEEWKSCPGALQDGNFPLRLYGGRLRHEEAALAAGCGAGLRERLPVRRQAQRRLHEAAAALQRHPQRKVGSAAVEMVADAHWVGIPRVFTLICCFPLVMTASNVTAPSGGESQEIRSLCSRTTGRTNSQWMRWIMGNQRKKTRRRRAQRNSRSQTRKRWATLITSRCILYPSILTTTLVSLQTCPGVWGAKIAAWLHRGAWEDGAASSRPRCQSKWTRAADAGRTAVAASEPVSICHLVLCYPPTNEHACFFVLCSDQRRLQALTAAAGWTSSPSCSPSAN